MSTLRSKWLEELESIYGRDGVPASLRAFLSAMGHTNPSLSQVGYRVRNDNGSQTTATWVANENTGATLNVDTNYRIRFVVDETAGGAETVQFKLQYNLNGAGWNDVNASSSVARSSASGNFTDGAATTRQLTSGSGTFLAGVMDEVDGATGVNTVFASQEIVEHEFCFQIRSADVVHSDLVQLRLVRSTGTVLEGYTQTPSIQVNDPLPPVALNQASETNTAQSFTRNKKKTLGFPTESYAGFFSRFTVVLASAAPITFYLQNQATGGTGDEAGWEQMGETPVAAATLPTGWVVGTGFENASALASRAERASSTFVDDSPPDGTLDLTLKDAFRSENPLTGQFLAGYNWGGAFAVRSPTSGGSADGWFKFIFIKADADGGNATLLGTGNALDSGSMSNIGSGADSNSGLLGYSPGYFTINNQYLFIQLAWERTGAGGAAGTNIRLRAGVSSSEGTRIISAPFAPFGQTVSLNQATETNTAQSITDPGQIIALGLVTENNEASPAAIATFKVILGSAQELILYLQDEATTGTGNEAGWDALDTELAPAATTLPTGWVVGTGFENASAMASRAERAESTFVDDSPPDGSLDLVLKDAFRTKFPLNGQIIGPVYSWTGAFVVRATVGGGAQDGLIKWRLLKGSADGSNLVDLSQGQQHDAGSQSNIGSSDKACNILGNGFPTFYLNNEYLFIQIAWERLGSGGSASSNVRLRSGSGVGTGTRIIIPTFAPFVGQFVTLNQVTESDTARSLTPVGNILLGQAQETSTVFGLTVVQDKIIPLSFVEEQEFALSVGEPANPVISNPLMDSITTTGGTPKVTTDTPSGQTCMVVVPAGTFDSLTDVQIREHILAGTMVYVPPPGESLMVDEVNSEIELADHPEMIWYPNFEGTLADLVPNDFYSGKYTEPNYGGIVDTELVDVPEYGVKAFRAGSSSHPDNYTNGTTGPGGWLLFVSGTDTGSNLDGQTWLNMRKWIRSNNGVPSAAVKLGSTPYFGGHFRWGFKMERHILDGMTETAVKLSGVAFNPNGPDTGDFSTTMWMRRKLTGATRWQLSSYFAADYLPGGFNNIDFQDVFVYPDVMHIIEQYVLLNTPGLQDGAFWVKFDGKTIYEVTNVSLTALANMELTYIRAQVYHGGQVATPTQRLHAQVAMFGFANRRIGPPKLVQPKLTRDLNNGSWLSPGVRGTGWNAANQRTLMLYAGCHQDLDGRQLEFGMAQHSRPAGDNTGVRWADFDAIKPPEQGYYWPNDDTDIAEYDNHPTLYRPEDKLCVLFGQKIIKLTPTPTLLFGSNRDGDNDGFYDTPDLDAFLNGWIDLEIFNGAGQSAGAYRTNYNPACLVNPYGGCPPLKLSGGIGTNFRSTSGGTKPDVTILLDNPNYPATSSKPYRFRVIYFGTYPTTPFPTHGRHCIQIGNWIYWGGCGISDDVTRWDEFYRIYWPDLLLSTPVVTQEQITSAPIGNFGLTQSYYFSLLCGDVPRKQLIYLNGEGAFRYTVPLDDGNDGTWEGPFTFGLDWDSVMSNGNYDAEPVGDWHGFIGTHRSDLGQGGMTFFRYNAYRQWHRIEWPG